MSYQQYSFIEGLRKNSKLLLIMDNMQLYKKKNVYPLYTRYECYTKNCPVSVSIDDKGSCQLLSAINEHNHEPPNEFIKKLQITSSIKAECEKPSAKRGGIRDVFYEECLKYPDLAGFVSFPKMRRTLLNRRNKGLPPCPKSPGELKKLFLNKNIMNEFGMSKIDKKSFYKETIIEKYFDYTVFMSPAICETIQKSQKERHYLLDGTFKSVPKCGFKQLLIIYYRYLNQTFPFTYILMTNKSRLGYEHCFQFIDKNIFEFRADSFQSDFEPGLRKALKKVFPNASLTGCWFHFTQALRRNALKISNFSNVIQKSECLQKWYRRFFALPLVKPIHIEEMFMMLKAEIHENDTLKHHQALNIFLEYFEKQWMTKVTSAGFTVYKQSLRPTSELEEFNSMLNSKLQNSQLYKFLDTIINQDSSMSLSLEKACEGIFDDLLLSRKQQQLKCTKIDELTKMLDDEKISLNDFFNQIENKKNNLLSSIADNFILDDDENVISEEEDDDDDENVISEEEDDDDDEGIHFTQENVILHCILCLENPRNIVLFPCSHFKYCTDCYSKIQQIAAQTKSVNICPYCRQLVANTSKIIQ